MLLLPALLLLLLLAGAQPLTPKAAETLGQLDLAGRVGQMLHLSVKKVLFDYPNYPYVDEAKVRVKSKGLACDGRQRADHTSLQCLPALPTGHGMAERGAGGHHHQHAV